MADQQSTIGPEFEPRLRARYDELWQDVQRELEKYRGEQYEDLIQGGADIEDLATADLIADLDIAEIDRDVTEMRAIQHAIARIKRGTFGRCAACGEEIDRERLEALPHAVLCIDCQSRKEHARDASPSL